MNDNALKEIKEQKYIFSLDNNEIDIRVKGLVDNINVKGKKVLDSSSLDGFHTCQLHEAGAIVTASDIRPNNLAKALYRALYKGIHFIDYRLIDLEEMHKVVRKDEYNIHFWSGSFYHLSDPITVFKNIARLFEFTLLETHIAEPVRHTPIIEKDGYTGWEYAESGWTDPCSAKDNTKSFWLTRESLLKLFETCNIEIEKIIYQGSANPHGPRDCYLLKRKDA